MKELSLKNNRVCFKILSPSFHASDSSLETHSHIEIPLKSSLVKEMLDRTDSDSLVNESLF